MNSYTFEIELMGCVFQVKTDAMSEKQAKKQAMEKLISQTEIKLIEENEVKKSKFQKSVNYLHHWLSL